MKRGIFSKVFRRDTMAAEFQAIVCAGFTAIHLNLETLRLSKNFDAIPTATTDEAKLAFSGGSIEAVTLSATYNMAHPDDRVRSHAVAQMKKLIPAAAEMGIPALAVCTGSRDEQNMWRRHRDNDSLEAWQDMMRCFDALLPLCQAHHVSLLVEPEQANVVNSAEKTLHLIRELCSTQLGVILDASNLIPSHALAYEIPRTCRKPVAHDGMQGVIQSAIDLLGPYIAVAHAKDYALSSGGGLTFLPAGRGTMDYAHYGNCLRKSGFDGPILLHGLEEEDIPCGLAALACMDA